MSFAGAERERFQERVGQVKADQKLRHPQEGRSERGEPRPDTGAGQAAGGNAQSRVSHEKTGRIWPRIAISRSAKGEWTPADTKTVYGALSRVGVCARSLRQNRRWW